MSPFSSRNTTVDLSHIDTPPNMSHWPQFHNGVAAGLRIAHSSEVAYYIWIFNHHLTIRILNVYICISFPFSQLKSSWILYNQGRGSGGGADPGQLTNEHAGFLLGLGLNGHLQKLATLSMHDYLIKVNWKHFYPVSLCYNGFTHLHFHTRSPEPWNHQCWSAPWSGCWKVCKPYNSSHKTTFLYQSHINPVYLPPDEALWIWQQPSSSASICQRSCLPPQQSLMFHTTFKWRPSWAWA